MSETEFSIFAQKMAIVFMKDQSVEKFVLSLFSAIYFPDSEDNPVEEQLPRSYKAYYYGQNDITSIAKKIAYSLDSESFADKITLETDESIEILCDVFKDELPEINNSNYAVVIANRFKEIILNASKPKGKKIKHTNERNPTLKDKYGAYLLSESSICPNDGCSRSLYIKEKDKLCGVYEVVVIDPEQDENNVENLIAMCPFCCARYRANKSREAILRMKEIKKSLIESYESRGITEEQTIQESIRLVIEQISEIHNIPQIDLNYDPVFVRNKIEMDNNILYMKVKMHVNCYYQIVDDVFRSLSNEKHFRFNPFCQQVRYNYLRLRENGYEQDKIYYQMTKWICDATNGSWNACEIVISYFIQKCEVFDAIT